MRRTHVPQDITHPLIPNTRIVTATRSRDLAIDWLRFPLIVLIILIHSSGLLSNGQQPDFQAFPVYSTVNYLLSRILAQTAIPLFFFISAKLYFAQLNNTVSWLALTKKRVARLLLPFLCWNTFAILLYLFAQTVSAQQGNFSGSFTPIVNYTFTDWLSAYWQMGTLRSYAPTYPFLYTLWFLRDLFIMSVSAPFLFWIIKKSSFLPLVLFGTLWYFDRWIDTPSIDCVFFYILGATVSLRGQLLTAQYTGTNKPNENHYSSSLMIANSESQDKLRLSRKLYAVILLYLMMIIADFISRDLHFNGFIHRAGVLTGCFVFYKLASIAEAANSNSRIIALSPATFFVYLFHEPWLSFLKKAMARLINPASEAALFIVYLVPPLIIICIALGLYHIMNRFCPRMLRLLTGA